MATVSPAPSAARGCYSKWDARSRFEKRDRCIKGLVDNVAAGGILGLSDEPFVGVPRHALAQVPG
jgi:hypothetical protein